MRLFFYKFLLVGMLWPFSGHAINLKSPIPVVASFSILADITTVIGGERVSVTTLVGRNSDAHSFEPSPRTIQHLADAQMLVSNGLGFETWLSRVLESSGFSGTHVVASTGVKPRIVSDKSNHEHHSGHDHTDQDPHAWQDLSNGMLYANNIAKGLINIDPDNKPYYQQRLSSYLEEMRDLDSQLKTSLGSVAASKYKAVIAHDAFAYFGNAYGVEFIPAAGLASQAEPSAYEVARLLDLTKSYGKIGFFTEVGTNPKMIEQLARESGAGLGGPLYSDTLADPEHQAGTYLGMFYWNMQQLLQTLNPSFD